MGVIMVEITRHFSTTVFIVYKNKVLLHKHKKLGIIIPVGGHIDRDELPSESAIKEAKEETGLDVELYDSSKHKDIPTYLNRGEYMNLHKINEFHEHINFVFYAKSKSDKLKPMAGESRDITWYSKEEIESSTYLNLEVKTQALEASLNPIENVLIFSLLFLDA